MKREKREKEDQEDVYVDEDEDERVEWREC